MSVELSARGGPPSPSYCPTSPSYCPGSPSTYMRELASPSPCPGSTVYTMEPTSPSYCPETGEVGGRVIMVAKPRQCLPPLPDSELPRWFKATVEIAIECSTCLESKWRVKDRQELACGHFVCRDCLSMLRDEKCPECRATRTPIATPGYIKDALAQFASEHHLMKTCGNCSLQYEASHGDKHPECTWTCRAIKCNAKSRKKHDLCESCADKLISGVLDGCTSKSGRKAGKKKARGPMRSWRQVNRSHLSVIKDFIVIDEDA